MEAGRQAGRQAEFTGTLNIIKAMLSAVNSIILLFSVFCTER